MQLYNFYSYAICVILSHFHSAVHTLHLNAPTKFEVIRDKTHIKNKGLNQLTRTTGNQVHGL